MAKQLSDLLGEFKFKNSKFDPNQVRPDMLSSKEVGPTTGDIKIKNDETKILGVTLPKINLTIDGISLPYDRQYQKLAANALNIYGADSVRILSRGAVEPLQLAKRAVDRIGRTTLDAIGLNNTRFGGFVRNQLNGFTNPQFPTDEVNDANSYDPYTKSGLYTSLYFGGVKNNKNAIANTLTSFLTPTQFTQNVADIGPGGKVKIGGAAVDMAVNVGFNALQGLGNKLGLNSKRGAGKASISNADIGIGNTIPIFPSNTAIDHTTNTQLTGILTGQSQLMRKDRFYTLYESYDANKSKQGLRTLQIGTGDADADLQFDSYRNNTNTFSNTLFKNNIVADKSSDQYEGYSIYQEPGTGLNQYGKASFKFPNILDKNNPPKRFSSQVYTDIFVDTNDINYDLIANTREIGTDAKKEKRNDIDKLIAEGKESLKKSGKPNQFLENVIVNTGGIQTHESLSRGTLYDISSDLIHVKIDDIFLMSNLTGLTDTPITNWGEAKPIGSAFKFYFYESFEREISFKAQLYAKNSNELQLLWYKLNQIQLLNKPTGGGLGGIKGKIIPLQIGSIINEKYGFVSDCNINILDNSPWEIHKDSQAPFICEINITYKVINSNADAYSKINYVDIAKNSSRMQKLIFQDKLERDKAKAGELNKQFGKLDDTTFGSKSLIEMMNAQVPTGFPGTPDPPREIFQGMSFADRMRSFNEAERGINPLEGYNFTRPITSESSNTSSGGTALGGATP